MFSKILDAELEKRGLTIREAARQIGISHSTLIAARNGSRVLDTKTALAIAKWLDIPFASIIKEETDPKKIMEDNVVQALSIVFNAAPELKAVFIEAADELEKGTISLDDFSDVVEYATYKIRVRREKLNNGEGKTTSTEGGSKSN